jgi:hypothetical protein
MGKCTRRKLEVSASVIDCLAKFTRTDNGNGNHVVLPIQPGMRIFGALSRGVGVRRNVLLWPQFIFAR